MIGRLKGTLLHKQPPELLLDVQGVGYELSAPMTTFFRLPNSGEEITLHTHLVVREDVQQLYGFYDLSERELFRQLIKVNGVGPKMALAILSGIEYQDFVRCVNQGDVSALVKIPGVGKKTAERLLIEMRGKLTDKSTTQGETQINGSVSTSIGNAVADAESALIALGYKPAQASKAINRIAEPGLSSDEMIRRALKSMV